MSEIVSRAPNMEPNTGGPDAGNTAPGPCTNPFSPDYEYSPPPAGTPHMRYCYSIPPYPQPVLRYIDRTGYEANEVVATIRELVSNSRNDTWSGTVTELLAAAQAKMRLADATAQQVDQQIADLEDYLRIYDDIYHYHYRSGDAMLHGFCAAQVDEDGMY